jgi:hypothetical protein
VDPIPLTGDGPPRSTPRRGRISHEILDAGPKTGASPRHRVA